MVYDEGGKILRICDKLEAVPESKWYSDENKGFYTEAKGLRFCLSGRYDPDCGASDVELHIVDLETNRLVEEYSKVPSNLEEIFKNLVQTEMDKQDSKAKTRLDEFLDS